MPRRHVVLAVAFLLSACSTAMPSATPTPTSAPPAPTPSAPAATAGDLPPNAAKVYAAIRSQVEVIRGLKPTAAVDPVTIDEAQLRANLGAEFDATFTPAQLKDTEDLLVVLGLLPQGSSLRSLTLDFQSGQVAGYYSPDMNELFVVSRSGTLGPVDETTYAHEFTHQLQDQHVDLDKLGIDVQDQSDRSLARLALVEGDASSVQSTWMFANLDSKELGEVLAAGLDPAALAALQRAPRYLRDTALFPYQDGLSFATRLLTNGGYAAVDAAFADPPDSTEQILHPTKYLQREKPIAVTLPKVLVDRAGPGWTAAGQDTLGELILRIWLNEGGVSTADASTATVGWGGDRLVLLRGPGDAVSVALHTEWDTPADADEFAAAATIALAKIASGGRVVHPSGSTTVWIAIGDAAAAVATVAVAGA
ncbi:MAG: hypothetical protein HYX55_09185 [Chloroflexi bacterium]|nr:hypothetical protein [Chloroflexota bacterium]